MGYTFFKFQLPSSGDVSTRRPSALRAPARRRRRRRRRTLPARIVSRAVGGSIMSKLASDLLDDLDDISGDDEPEESGAGEGDAPASRAPEGGAPASGAPDRAAVAAVAAVGRPTASALLRDAAFSLHMERVEGAGGLTGDASDLELVFASQRFLARIADDVLQVHEELRRLYAPVFPELAKLVPSADLFRKAVEALGTSVDANLKRLDGLLPQATVMAISVSRASPSALPPPAPAHVAAGNLEAVLAGLCGELERLHTSRDTLLRFVASHMPLLAPNVCALAGADVAASLISLAGGLEELSRIPACNIEVLGQRKALDEESAGVDAFTMNDRRKHRHRGILSQCEIVQSAPEDVQRKALKLCAAKLVLCARSDAFRSGRGAGGDGVGLSYRKQILDKIDKLCRPAGGRTAKALPKPDDGPKKKRGGKRVRRMKERFKVTEMQKEANRLSFAKMDGADFADEAMGLGLGHLSSGRSKRLRAAAASETSANGKLGARRQRLEREKEEKRRQLREADGLYTQSSVMLTQARGIELVDPGAEAAEEKEAKATWFGRDRRFLQER